MQPYLSVVVVTRNDDHGGDPLRRLQALVNTFDQQCRRSGLDAELIIVEWNPPPEKPKLATLLKHPRGCPFPLRFIELPPSVHATLPYGDVLPLFQMIGKNVGIVRARGQFVLATNIDIVFSNELVDWIARKPLEAHRMYRVDRHDIEPRYPVDAPLEEQMAYCDSHHIRIHTWAGTHPTDAEGHLVARSPDVFDPPGVVPTRKWHVREGEPVGGFFRWADATSSLLVSRSAARSGTGVALYLDVESNPFQAGSWIELEVRSDHNVLGQIRAFGRHRSYIPLPDGLEPLDVRLTALAGSPVSREPLPEYERREGLAYRIYSAKLESPLYDTNTFLDCGLDGWKKVDGLPDLTAERVDGGIRVSSSARQHAYCLVHRPMRAPADGTYAFALDYTCQQGNISFDVLDLTSDRWIPVRRFVMTRGHREEQCVSCELMRGQTVSLHVSNCFPGGDGVSRFVVHGLRGSTAVADLTTASDVVVALFRARRRYRNLRVRVRAAVGRLVRSKQPKPEIQQSDRQPWALQSMSPEAFLKRYRPPAVAQNACGDFQLMAREHWLDLRGYPEFCTYSMNIDGLFADIAEAAGIREHRLEPPCCIYHLEHEKGSGWTPEGEALLRKRIAESGITWVDATTVGLWASCMTWLKRPMIFNGSDWGFGNLSLPETVVDATRSMESTRVQ